MPVCQGAQMTAYAPLIIPSVGMVEDLTCVAAVQTRTVQRMSCVILIHMSASPNLRLAVTITMLTVPHKSVMSHGPTPLVSGVMALFANQAVLKMGSVQRTNQYVELVDNLTGVDAMLTLTARLVTSVVTMSASLLSALEMMIVRMVSVMSTILLTILSVSIVRLSTVFQAVLTPVTALMGTSVMLISAQLMRARPC